MSKPAKIGIVAGVVTLLVVLLYFFGFKGSDEGYVTDDWTMTYDPADRGPYGTYMMKELLDTTGLFGNFLEINEELEGSLEDDPEENDIYFFVGSENYLSDSSTTFLLNFVRRGNSAFIAAEEFPFELRNMLFYDVSQIFESDEVVDSVQHCKFYHNQLASKRYEFEFINQNKRKLKTWHYFDKDGFSLGYEDSLSALGSNTEDKWNFVKINYGKGQIYLHSNPYLFTNIMMMRRDGFQYAENVLKHIPPGRVQWDRYNLQWHYEYDDFSDGDGGGEERRSILEFIIQNPPLLWAFLILVAGAILYALFKGKRMQKIIPAVESKDNMSLQYINTLSSLYLQEKKHNKLIRLKEKTFLNFIAEHYYIQSNKADEKFIEKVAVKSQVPKEKIVEIFELFNELEQSSVVSDQALIQLHQKIENFYKICR